MARYAFVLLMFLAMTGCAAQIRNLTITQYLNESFTAHALQGGGLALLPITVGEGQEGYRRPLGEMFNRRLPKAVPNGRTLTWQASMDSLNSHELVAEYQQAIEAYRRTSILDRDRVKTMARDLGARYALYCTLEDLSEHSSTSYNFFTCLQSSTTANVSAHCLVLDLSNADIAQEILGQAPSRAGDFEYNLPREAYPPSIAQAVLMRLQGSTVKVESRERNDRDRC